MQPMRQRMPAATCKGPAGGQRAVPSRLPCGEAPSFSSSPFPHLSSGDGNDRPLSPEVARRVCHGKLCTAVHAGPGRSGPSAWFGFSHFCLLPGLEGGHGSCLTHSCLPCPQPSAGTLEGLGTPLPRAQGNNAERGKGIWGALGQQAPAWHPSCSLLGRSWGLV